MKLAILDFNRTIYDPETDALTEGALELLQLLKNDGYTNVLVSRKEAGRQNILQSLGVAAFFAETLFTPEKSKELFLDLIMRFNAHNDALVIGDYLHQEIRFGNQAGARTIHFKKGRFKDLAIESPDDIAWRTITDLSEIRQLIM